MSDTDPRPTTSAEPQPPEGPAQDGDGLAQDPDGPTQDPSSLPSHDPVAHPVRTRVRHWVFAVLGMVRRHRVRTVVVVMLVVAVVIAGTLVVARPDKPGWARSPESAVRGYLKAVADGRADDALAYVDQPPEDRTFLTDEVLAHSRALAPMTGITVKKDKYSLAVKAHYRLGDKARSENYVVTQKGDYYFVAQVQPIVLTKVDFYMDGDPRRYYPVMWADVPMLINGTPLPDGAGRATLFPGRYRATPNHPFVAIDQQFTVGAPALSVDDRRVELRPALSAEGAERIAQAAQARFDACLAQHSLVTDCRFGLDGPTLDPATISWSGQAGLAPPDRYLTPGYEYPGVGNMGLAGVVVKVDLQVTCTWTDETGQTQSKDATQRPNHYMADATDPDNIVITFGNRGDLR